MKLSIDLPLHLKSLGDAGEFVAIAWDFNQVDRQGDMILPGAFSESLSRHAAQGSMPAMLWQHKNDEPVGSWLSLEEKQDGLEAHGRLELSIQKAAEAYPLLKSKGLSLSIGFQAKESDSYTESGVRYFKRVDLAEISLVSVPANPGAVVRAVKTLDDCDTPKEFEGLVRDALGLSRRQAKTLTGLAWPALTQRDAEPADDPEQIIAALKAASVSIRGNTQ